MIPVKSRPRKSWLYVPADKKEWYERLAANEADLLVLDLEDAVGKAQKETARRILVQEAPKTKAFSVKEFFVRVNAVGSSHFLHDIEAVKKLSPAPAGIVLPKLKSGEEIKELERRLKDFFPSLEIVPVIELLEAEYRVVEILQASDRIRWVQFAESGDYSLDFGRFGKTLDAMADPEALDFALRVLKACKMLRKGIVDGAHLNIKDPAGLKKRCEWAFGIGFEGKAAIHPDQVAVINPAFSPDNEKIDLAREMVGLYEEKGGTESFIPHRGSFLTPPKYEAAKRFLKKHGK